MSTREQDVLSFLTSLDEEEQRSGVGISRAQAARSIHGQVDSPTEDEVLSYLDSLEKPGILEAMGRGGFQGLTSEFGDEAVAGVASLPALASDGESYGEAFSENVEGARSRNEAAREAHPIAFGLSELMGFAAPAVGATLMSGGTAAPGVAARGTQMLARLLARPVAGGAVQGGLAAAGAAEGGVVDRLDDAALGAAGGAVLGGVGDRLIRAGPRVGGALLGGVAGGASDDQGSPVQGAALGAVAGAAGGAGGARLARGVLDKVRGSASNLLPTAAEQGATKLATALEREGIEDVGGLAAGALPGQTIMDVGEAGGPLARLGRSVEAIPSEGGRQVRSFLTDRAEAAPSRINAALQKEAGLTFEDATQTARQLAAARKANADELYPDALDAVVPHDLVPEIAQDDVFREAFGVGVDIARREGYDLDLAAGLPVRALDYMKQGLDDVIERGAEGARKIGRHQARVLRKQLNAVLARVDDVVPEYGAARATYAGDSAVMKAFEEGIEDFSARAPNANEVRARVAEMGTPSEAEFYRRGGIEALRRKLASVTDFGRNPDVTRQIVGNEEQRRAVQELFRSNDDFVRFMDQMRGETGMAGTKNTVLGNSQTARIQEDVADFQGGGLRISDLLNPTQLIESAAQSGISSRLRGFNESTADALAPLLTRELSGEGASSIQNELQRYLEMQSRRNRALGVGPRALAGGAGAFLGSTGESR